MSFRFIALDPRRGTDQLTPEDWARTLGVEVTVQALADACGLGNIDPQHGYGRCSYDGLVLEDLFAGGGGRAGKPDHVAAACSVAAVTSQPTDGAILATVRPDVDSVAAMAVLILRSVGTTDIQDRGGRARHDYLEHFLDHPAHVNGGLANRIADIAASDAFSPGAAWAPRALPTTENLWPTTAAPVSETRELAPLGALCSPVGRQAKWPLDTRAHALACWLLWGMPAQANLAGWGSAAVAREIAVACNMTGLDDEENEAGPSGALNRAIHVLTNAAEDALTARKAIAKAIESGDVAPRTIAGVCRCGDPFNEQPGGTPGRVACGECGDASGRPMIAVVESAHIGAIGLGYCGAPIVVAAMPPGPTPAHEHHVVITGDSFADRSCAGCVPGPRKYTIAAWSADLVNFDGLKAALCEIEPGWGGGASILGSPQGTGSMLPIDQVLAAVRRHISASK